MSFSSHGPHYKEKTKEESKENIQEQQSEQLVTFSDPAKVYSVAMETANKFL